MIKQSLSVDRLDLILSYYEASVIHPYGSHDGASFIKRLFFLNLNRRRFSVIQFVDKTLSELRQYVALN